MESELARDRRRRQLVLTFGLILGLVAAGATYFLASRPSQTARPTPTPPPQRTIVIAAEVIPARALIVADMLETTTLADDPVLESTVSDPSLIIGKVALIQILEGQALTSNLYSDGNAAGLAILGPDETIGPDTPVWRAVSVNVPRDRAVAGFVSAGDRIDLTVTLNLQVFDETGEPVTVPVTAGAASKVTYLDLEVLNSDPESGLYVLKVDLNQAEEIAHIQSSTGNTFAISLRPTADDRELDRDDYGETTDRIIDQYGFPIPRVIIVPIPPATPSPFPTPEPSPSPSPAP